VTVSFAGLSRRPHLVRLRDILETIDAVSEMIAGVDFAGYRRDYKLRRAVEPPGTG
jgi:hypothetical protein